MAFLRKATQDDCELFFNWANEAETRLNAVNTGLILWNDHIAWFSKRIHSSETKLYVLINGNIPVGQVRIEKEQEHYVITYSIDKQFRRQGFGKEAIGLLLKLQPDKSFKAVVNIENDPSVKIFEKYGFVKSSFFTANEKKFVILLITK